jgi:hypothetical protein
VHSPPVYSHRLNPGQEQQCIAGLHEHHRWPAGNWSAVREVAEGALKEGGIRCLPRGYLHLRCKKNMVFFLATIALVIWNKHLKLGYLTEFVAPEAGGHSLHAIF